MWIYETNGMFIYIIRLKTRLNQNDFGFRKEREHFLVSFYKKGLGKDAQKMGQRFISPPPFYVV